MELYRIIDIQEADYGCEECGEDGPHALLIMEEYQEPISDKTPSRELGEAAFENNIASCSRGFGVNIPKKKYEVSERFLAEHGIREGGLVCFLKDERSGRMMLQKAVRVVAAIIVKEDVDEISMKRQKKIFATQRGYGEFKDGWEFPGGKIEPGETPEQALVREIREELDTEIEVGDWFAGIEYDYPDFHLSMDCLICTVTEGKLVLKEHEAARWLSREDLDSVDWLPADISLIEQLRGFLE